MNGMFYCKEDRTYRMPVHFREMAYNADNRVVYQNVMNVSVEQQTDMEALARYVPREFTIERASVLWNYLNCRDVDFMTHGEYRIFQAAVPVCYRKNGETISGVYPLIIFENDITPILGGREEDGMPKVYCDIAAERHHDKHWFASAALYCETMLRIDFHEDAPVPEQELAQMRAHPLTNNFGYRYIPLVGSSGAATTGPILYPQEAYPELGWRGTGGVRVTVPGNWYENPSFYTALKALKELPNHGFVHAMRAICNLRLCVADSRAL